MSAPTAKAILPTVAERAILERLRDGVTLIGMKYSSGQYGYFYRGSREKVSEMAVTVLRRNGWIEEVECPALRWRNSRWEITPAGRAALKVTA